MNRYSILRIVRNALVGFLLTTPLTIATAGDKDPECGDPSAWAGSTRMSLKQASLGYPNNVKWYSTHLIAMNEQPIEYGQDIIRFLWLRTFHNPVVIVLKPTQKNNAMLTLKIADGAGGYQIGELIKHTNTSILMAQYSEFIDNIQSCDFFNLPTSFKTLGLDGSDWILEVQINKYHTIERWSPSSGCIFTLGSKLIKLSKHKFKEIY